MNKPLRSITPKKVYFADEKDDRKCCGCSSDFSVTCLKHACRKCNKFYCGKCSSSNVTTINRTLVRERLCTKCLDIQPNTPSSPGRSSKKTLFTPSKLHLLEGSDGKNAVSSLWSADTETDCDSDDCEDAQVQQEIKESVKENLSKSLLDEIVAFSNGNTESDVSNLQLEKTQTPSALPVHIARTPFSATTTPKNEDLLRNLCDASFSDTLSMTSSVSSRGSLIPRRSPAVQLMCMGCNVSFGTVFQRILCSRCTKHFCEGCSTTSETTHYGMVYQQRVCSGCLDVLPDTPFTPGTVHLEEASSVASSLPSGEVNRNVAARLWSGGTTFSEFSVGVSSSIGISQGSSGNIRLSEEEEEESDDEQNISMDSITENLIDIIQEESITVSAQPVQVSDFETEAENANAVLSDSNEGDARGVEVKREADDSSFVVNDVDPVREDAQLQKKEEDVSVQVHFPVRPLKVQRLLAVALVLCVLLSALLWMPLYEYVASEPALLGVQEQPFLVQVQQTVVKAASEPVVLLVQQASSAESSDDQCTTDKAKELGSSQPSAPDAPVALVAAALTNVSTAESSSSGPVVTAHQVVAARIPQLFKSLLRMVVSKFQSLLDKVIMDGLRLFGRLKVKQAT